MIAASIMITFMIALVGFFIWAEITDPIPHRIFIFILLVPITVVIGALGIVKGTTVHSKNFGRDFLSAMKTLVGGKIKDYTEMLNEARQIAMKRMVDEAETLGADAVLNVRFASSSVMQSSAEVVAYGTAVKILN